MKAAAARFPQQQLKQSLSRLQRLNATLIFVYSAGATTYPRRPDSIRTVTREEDYLLLTMYGSRDQEGVIVIRWEIASIRANLAVQIYYLGSLVIINP